MSGPARPSMRARAVAWTQSAAPGIAVAAAAGVVTALRAALPVNDDFMHRAYARQLLAGELPVRDFFDYGMGLMYALSAVAEAVLGYRLLAEAALAGLFVAVSAWLVYDVVRRATGSTAAAVLAALVCVVAAPRSYGYPKLFVYAVAAWLWWDYVWRPDRRRALALGLWAGVAFYWRPDHGAYVAAGVALALLAAHGPRRLALTRGLEAGAAAIALVLPWLIFASVQTGGLVAFVRSGVTAAVEEHRSTGQALPRWPVRGARDVVRIDPPERYAAVVGVRWAADAGPAERARVLRAYGLTPVSPWDGRSQQVRLSRQSLDSMPALLAEPAVEDTAGIERGAGTVSDAAWPPFRRWRFEHWWLRIRVLPALDDPRQAAEAAVVLLVLVPLLAAGAAVAWRHRLPAGVTVGRVACFAAFALLVDLGLLRTPFLVRAADAVILPAVLLAIVGAAVVVRDASGPRWARQAAIAVVVLLLARSLAVAGESGERARWLMGEFVSAERAAGAWREVRDRLVTSPPIDYWRGRDRDPALTLAAYARDCVPPTDRVLVLWFAPEIHYYADRLMAGRHLFYLRRLGALPHERRMELDKVRRTAPLLVLVKEGSAQEPRAAFPEVLDLVDREYDVGGRLDADDRYLVLVRRGREPVRVHGETQWPCFTG